MLHPPKPSAPATLHPNKDATPAPTTGTINVNKTVHPNAAGTSAHATATASQPTDNLPSDVTMRDAAAAASSEQPGSIPSSNPQSSLVGADHAAGPFAATTVGNSAQVVGRNNGPQGKALGVIGGASGKLSEAPGLLSGVSASEAPLQRDVDSSTHAASTAMGLPVSASWQGKARLDQAAGSGSQEGKKNNGELAAQTGPMSLGGSLGSVGQGKKRKVPEATGGILALHWMLSISMHARLLAAFSSGSLPCHHSGSLFAASRFLAAHSFSVSWLGHQRRSHSAMSTHPSLSAACSPSICLPCHHSRCQFSYKLWEHALPAWC